MWVFLLCILRASVYVYCRNICIFYNRLRWRCQIKFNESQLSAISYDNSGRVISLRFTYYLRLTICKGRKLWLHELMQYHIWPILNLFSNSRASMSWFWKGTFRHRKDFVYEMVPDIVSISFVLISNVNRVWSLCCVWSKRTAVNLALWCTSERQLC